MHGGAGLEGLLLEGPRGARRLGRDQLALHNDYNGKLTPRIGGTEVLLHGRDEIVTALLEELAVDTSTHDIHKSRKSTLVVGSHGLPYLSAVPSWICRLDLPPWL